MRRRTRSRSRSRPPGRRALTFAGIGVAILIAGVCLYPRGPLLWEYFLHTRFHLGLLAMMLAIACALVRSFKLSTALVLAAAWAFLPDLRPGGPGDSHPPATTAAEFTELKLIEFNLSPYPEKVIGLEAFLNDESPDLIVFIEASPRWDRILRPVYPAFPYVEKTFDRIEGGGRIICSRVPLSESAVHSLAPGTRDMLEVTATPDGRPLRIFAFHPFSPRSPQATWSNQQSLIYAASIISSAARNGPTLVAGDLNTTHYTALFRFFERASHVQRAYPPLRRVATWPAELGWAGIPIDHVLVSKEVTITSVRAGPDLGSDHRPLVVTFRYRNGSESE